MNNLLSPRVKRPAEQSNNDLLSSGLDYANNAPQTVKISAVSHKKKEDGLWFLFVTETRIRPKSEQKYSYTRNSDARGPKLNE